MHESAAYLSEKDWPDTSHLITEDDEPLDSTFQERQQQLFLDILHCSWQGTQDSPKFIALANVGLFYSLKSRAVVPDLMVSLGVDLLPCKRHKSYFVWEYGKVPELVIEVVSREVNSEDRFKPAKYAQMGIPYYVLYDPFGFLSKKPLRVFEHHGRDYLEVLKPRWLKQLALGLTIWEGTYRGCTAKFLRFCDQQDQLLATGEEKSESERQRADAERQRADAERQRAEAAEAEVAELRRQLGL